MERSGSLRHAVLRWGASALTLTTDRRRNHGSQGLRWIFTLAPAPVRAQARSQATVAAKRMLRSSQGLRVIGALVEIRSMPVAA